MRRQTVSRSADVWGESGGIAECPTGAAGCGAGPARPGGGGGAGAGRVPARRARPGHGSHRAEARRTARAPGAAAVGPASGAGQNVRGSGMGDVPRPTMGPSRPRPLAPPARRAGPRRPGSATMQHVRPIASRPLRARGRTGSVCARSRFRHIPRVTFAPTRIRCGPTCGGVAGCSGEIAGEGHHAGRRFGPGPSGADDSRRAIRPGRGAPPAGGHGRRMGTLAPSPRDAPPDGRRRGGTAPGHRGVRPPPERPRGLRPARGRRGVGAVSHPRGRHHAPGRVHPGGGHPHGLRGAGKTPRWPREVYQGWAASGDGRRRAPPPTPGGPSLRGRRRRPARSDLGHAGGRRRVGRGVGGRTPRVRRRSSRTRARRRGRPPGATWARRRTRWRPIARRSRARRRPASARRESRAAAASPGRGWGQRSSSPLPPLPRRRTSAGHARLNRRRDASSPAPAARGAPSSRPARRSGRRGADGPRFAPPRGRWRGNGADPPGGYGPLRARRRGRSRPVRPRVGRAPPGGVFRLAPPRVRDRRCAPRGPAPGEAPVGGRKFSRK